MLFENILVYNEYYNTMTQPWKYVSDGNSEIEYSILFDIFKTFDQIESSHGCFLSEKNTIFLHAFAPYSEIPYDIGTMDVVDSKGFKDEAPQPQDN